MNGKNHIVSSVAVTSSIYTKLGLKTHLNQFTPKLMSYILPVSLIGVLGVAIPDIDLSDSIISHCLSSKKIKNDKLVKCIETIIIVIAIIALKALNKNMYFQLVLAWLIPLIWSTHRTLSHSLISLIVLGSLVFLGCKTYNKPWYGISFIIGYTLHLCEDMLTASGIPLLYPCKKIFRIPIAKSKFNQNIVVICICVISLILML